MNVQLYLKLMRFHQPIGIFLLWWPTAWSLWLAHEGKPPPSLILLFLIGTIGMRAAGCVVNDIADRNIDRHVERTKCRPLTSGKLSLVSAFVLLIVLLLVAVLVLMQLPHVCFYFALIAVGVTFLYPFCKRFIQSPQLILGIAFSMGIPMAFATAPHIDYQMLLTLLVINFLWVIAYDTEYAMVDREDDLRIGVKSTAILFANYDKSVIACLQFFLHLFWIFIGLKLQSKIFCLFWCCGAFNLFSQQQKIDGREPSNCLKAFKSNHWYGLSMWLAIILS